MCDERMVIIDRFVCLRQEDVVLPSTPMLFRRLEDALDFVMEKLDEYRVGEIRVFSFENTLEVQGIVDIDGEEWVKYVVHIAYNVRLR